METIRCLVYQTMLFVCSVLIAPFVVWKPIIGGDSEEKYIVRLNRTICGMETMPSSSVMFKISEVLIAPFVVWKLSIFFAISPISAILSLNRTICGMETH